MIGLQWRPGKPERGKPRRPPVVVAVAPFTPASERAPSVPASAVEPPKRKRGRPRKA